MLEIGRFVDIDFAAGERANHHGTQRRIDEGTRTFVAFKSMQLRKKLAGEDGGSAIRSLIGRRGDCRSGMRLMRGDERAEMCGSETRLIARDEKSAGVLGSARIQFAKTSANGCGDAPLPILVEDGNGILKIDACADGGEMRAKHDQKRMRLSLARNAQGALKQQFPADGDELLGLAKASAFSSGEKNGRDGHRYECKSAFLTARWRSARLKKHWLHFSAGERRLRDRRDGLHRRGVRRG